MKQEEIIGKRSLQTQGDDVCSWRCQSVVLDAEMSGDVRTEQGLLGLGSGGDGHLAERMFMVSWRRKPGRLMFTKEREERRV